MGRAGTVLTSTRYRASDDLVHMCARVCLNTFECQAALERLSQSREADGEGSEGEYGLWADFMHYESRVGERGDSGRHGGGQKGAASWLTSKLKAPLLRDEI